jgi:WD40 repeat protein
MLRMFRPTLIVKTAIALAALFLFACHAQPDTPSTRQPTEAAADDMFRPTSTSMATTTAAADAMLRPTFTPMATAEPTKEYWGWTRSIAISNDGSSVAVGTDRGVVAFDTESWNVLCSISTEHPVTALAFSPDGRQLAFGLDQGQLMIIDAISHPELATIRPLFGMSKKTFRSSS